MQKYELHIKKIILGAALAALSFPLIQCATEYFKEASLKGFITKKEKTWFTVNGWFTGAYQDSTVGWFNENFGFRPTFVRVRNQVYFELCNKVHANGVIVGKDQYLHDGMYVNAYLGKDFKGEAHWRDLSAAFKQLQDSLAKQNITMIVTLAPGKASYCFESIPDALGKPSGKTNYKSFSAELKAHNVNLIDFYDWFMQMKKTAVYPLYAKGGVHWSNYGSTLAADSLIRYIEKKTGTNLPSIKIKKMVWSDTTREPDNDMGDAMNLLFPLSTMKMAYPEIEFENTGVQKGPGMYVVSDSYFWQMYHMGFPKYVFKDIQFDYYNRLLYDSKKKFLWDAADVAQVPVDLKRNKILLFMVTEANLKDFPWGFLEKIGKQINLPEDNSSLKTSIAEYENKIRANQQWLNEISVKAKTRNIPLDSMIKLDAAWMAKEDEKNKK